MVHPELFYPTPIPVLLWKSHGGIRLVREISCNQNWPHTDKSFLQKFKNGCTVAFERRAAEWLKQICDVHE